WGSIGVVVDLLYRLAPASPLSVGFWRVAIAAPALLVISRVYAGPAIWRIQRRDWPALALMGAAFAAYQVCYFAAIAYIGVAAAVLLNICSAPIIVAVLSSLWLRERPTPAIVAVLVAALIGAGLLAGGSPQAATPAALVAGSLLALGAGLAYSLVALTGRVLAPRYHPAQPTALAFTLSALLLFPFAAAGGLNWHYSAAGWALVLYLGLVPTALGYALYLRGLRTTTATVSAIIALVEPLVSTAVAVSLLGERLSATALLGGLLLLGSVTYLYRSAGKRADPKGLQDL
ncbi:MAG: EamA family transporter, partial [Anaerolineales bacterium]